MAATDDERLVDALVQSGFVVMSTLNRIGAEHNLSLTQLRVLGILRDRRLRMLELADFLGLEKSTMSGLVVRAEARGLLLRERNPDDGRAVDVFLSSSGAELGERIHAEVRQALASDTERLDQAERKALTRLLEGMLGPAPRSGATVGTAYRGMP